MVLSGGSAEWQDLALRTKGDGALTRYGRYMITTRPPLRRLQLVSDDLELLLVDYST